ncbi:RNA polymerase II subunit A [Corchorus olitorius]|uniref:RNA polymerase II subunit A C-terminal domain phosphatase SSU72 n=1 Tax=Corchorus olitorius TaxID=93759 RepID=A0A1R3IFL2_9ROSI|nr:RNA polymerase II subunit A [Corchorus olitorius]
MKYRFAMVCSSNQNRNMEAHSAVEEAGVHVKLPVPSLRELNLYNFGTVAPLTSPWSQHDQSLDFGDLHNLQKLDEGLSIQEISQSCTEPAFPIVMPPQMKHENSEGGQIVIYSFHLQQSINCSNQILYDTRSGSVYNLGSPLSRELELRSKGNAIVSKESMWRREIRRPSNSIQVKKF